MRNLYVHVPFCLHKCDYCAFYSEVADASRIERYVEALIREMERVAPALQPHTVYFGGGTPLLLSRPQWNHLFQAMNRLSLTGAVEWTVEANPATVTREKALDLRAHGVNRVSLGIQSLDDALLERLGRVHSRDQARQAFECLREAGFDNINLDLMFAIPGQSLDTWRETLSEALSWGSEHLSCYEVIYEEDTPLYEQLHAQAFEVDENLACDMYEALIDQATAAGFHQYEVANFARHHHAVDDLCRTPNLACQHNVNYWRGGSFLGLGPGATSYVNGVRARNWPNTDHYVACLARGERPFESSETLSPLARAGETAAFGLRMVRGWAFAEFQHLTGFDLRQEWAAEMDQILRVGFGERDDDGFRLTPRGLRFADWVAEQFLR